MDTARRTTVRPRAANTVPPGDGYIMLTRAAGELAGYASYRMLDYWTTTLDIVPVVHTTRRGEPSEGGSGSIRWLSPEAFANLRVVAQLVDYGWNVDALVEIDPQQRLRLRDCARQVLGR